MTNQIKIRICLLKNGVTQAQIAAETKMSRPMVSRVIKGDRRNKKVIDALIKYGCPPEYFNLKQQEA